MSVSVSHERYGTLQYAGSGPSGHVWIGSSADNGKIVLYEHRISEKAAVDSLRRELSRVTALRHENVISIFDVSVDQGRLWIAAQFVESNSFPTCARSQPGAHARTRITLGIMDAVSAAHDLGVLHGALDPDCVRVTLAGQAKVMGFGLQPGGEEQYLAAESLSSRIRYRAPEMITTAQATAASDQYSIGRIGQWALRGLPGDAARELRCVLARASSASPADRFASVAELRAAFTERGAAAGLAMDGVPVSG
jgi:serine/threonine-protein kinase